MKTDLEIETDVKAELAWEPRLDKAPINASVNHGIVTLSGITDNYPKKIAAEKAAFRVNGVKGIKNNIEILLSKLFERSDYEIEKDIKDAFKLSGSIPTERITVKVKDGWITLEGNLEWDFERRRTKKLVEHLWGVKGINNLLKIKPDADLISEIKNKICSALKRNINNGERITVDINTDKITLSGKVRSIYEKYSAETIAWAAPGISHVENKLEVSHAEVYA